MACIIMVSTLSGENLSLCLERECDKPRDMVLIFSGTSAGISDERWLRIER